MLSLVGTTQMYSSFLEHNCPRRGCLPFHLYHFLLKNKTNKKNPNPASTFLKTCDKVAQVVKLCKLIKAFENLM